MLVRVVMSLINNDLQRYLKRNLADADVQLETLKPSKSVWQKVTRSGYDVIIISEALILRPVYNGITILNSLPENPTTIIIHGDDSAEEHALLVGAGADVVLYEGVSRKSMLEAIETALESRRQFISTRRFDRRGLGDPQIDDFVSESLTMQIFMEDVQRVIPSDSPILLTGETGVGKEHLAKAIHADSPRRVGPFIAINAAAMPEPLLESELFGHEQGAFTGAVRYRRGAFEMAHGGTIFLDEIGDMPLPLQAKLLRVLQDYEIKPVGGESAIELDVRVMTATNRNLEAEIEQGRFRQDLFYRLSVLTLNIPPLRYRREDISTMVRRFMTHYRYRIGREVHSISDRALASLCDYDWPGNVRELMNVIERAILIDKDNEIGMDDLPHAFRGVPPATNGDSAYRLEFNAADWLGRPLPEVRESVCDQVERRYLEMALQKTGGRVAAAAKIAGIHPRGMYGKMKRFGLRKETFKKRP